MTLLQTILKHFTWYGFLALFTLTALLLAFASGAGVVFSLILAGLIALMQLGWLALGELRQARQYQAAQLELTAQLLKAHLRDAGALGRAPSVKQDQHQTHAHG